MRKVLVVGSAAIFLLGLVYSPAIAQDKVRSRQVFNEKVGQMKDQRKKQVVENLDERLGSVNGRWASHFGKLLDKLTLILDKLEAKTNELASQGKDVADVKNAIIIARASIASAKNLVNTQAGNSYVIDLSNERNLGGGVKTLISTMRTDMGLVKDAVNKAKEDVRDVHAALKAVSTTGSSSSPAARWKR